MSRWTVSRALVASIALGACASPDSRPPPSTASSAPLAPKTTGEIDSPWQELWTGPDLTPFVATPFPLAGEVRVAPHKGHPTLVLDWGDPLTGVHLPPDIPAIAAMRRSSYELEVIAARIDGSDFFCGLTFPVADRHLTLILGGWGGSLVGLSCLDGRDASDNETRCYHDFQTGRFYRVRVRVVRDRERPRHLIVTIDDETVIHVDLTTRHLSLRPEVAPSRPLGIATYATEAEIRSLRWRPMPND